MLSAPLAVVQVCVPSVQQHGSSTDPFGANICLHKLPVCPPVMQWRKTVSLECSLQLLDDIQLVSDAPGRITQGLAEKVGGGGGAGGEGESVRWVSREVRE